VESERDELPDISSIAELEKFNSKGALKLLKDIQKIEKIRPKIPGDDYIYRFMISGRTLVIPSSKMLTPSMFSRRYLEEFNELPSEDVYEHWGLIVNAVNEEGLIHHLEDNEENDETFAAETFLNFIRKFQILKKEERYQYKQNKQVLFCHNSNLYLPSEMVKKVLDNAHIRIKIQRLNQLINKYKIDVGTIRYGKASNETIRCWIFSPNLISEPLISIANLPEDTQQKQVQERE
jgi:hypothetical protein